MVQCASIAFWKHLADTFVNVTQHQRVVCQKFNFHFNLIDVAFQFQGSKNSAAMCCNGDGMCIRSR